MPALYRQGYEREWQRLETERGPAQPPVPCYKEETQADHPSAWTRGSAFYRSYMAGGAGVLTWDPGREEWVPKGGPAGQVQTPAGEAKDDQNCEEFRGAVQELAPEPPAASGLAWQTVADDTPGLLSKLVLTRAALRPDRRGMAPAGMTLQDFVVPAWLIDRAALVVFEEGFLSVWFKHPGPLGNHLPRTTVDVEQLRALDSSKYPEFVRLSEFLRREGVPDAYPIYFREESAADNRFALSVRVNSRNGRPGLLRKLAAYFGCPAEDLPSKDEAHFEACDSWHGARGRDQGDLRALADEITKDQGEGFFDCEYTVGEIRTIASEPT